MSVHPSRVTSWQPLRTLVRAAERAMTRASDADEVRGNAARLLVNGTDAFPAWLEAITSARHWVHLENYIIRDDATGRCFRDALVDRAAAGVSVRVLYDWVGCWATPRSFWRSRRLEPQLRRALDAGAFSQQRGEWDRLLAMLPQLLAPAEEDGPSLLHGDLWHGNVLCTRTGPALIDPAVYRGHREVDLAMARLFGGFDPRFFAAYHEVRPLLPGWQARLPVYQLYFLLVHVNLFGGAYVQQTAGLLSRCLGSRAA